MKKQQIFDKRADSTMDDEEKPQSQTQIQKDMFMHDDIDDLFGTVQD